LRPASALRLGAVDAPALAVFRVLDAGLLGGADVAAELDAKRAIRQGTELAARI
jgi:hypothetical protein